MPRKVMIKRELFTRTFSSQWHQDRTGINMMNIAPTPDTPLFQLIYESEGTRSFSPSEIEALLVSSRLSNVKRQITGILLYRQGTFTQVLEGDEAAVRALLEKICRDPRHRNVSIRLEQTIQARSFPNWSMAYSRRDLSEVMVR